MTELLIYVRLTREAASGERSRSVHLVAVNRTTTEVLIALCGKEFRKREAERLDMIAGMPCFACLVAAPNEIEMSKREIAGPPAPRPQIVQ